VYYRFKNDKYEEFIRLKIEGTVSSEVIEQYPMVKDLMKGLVLKIDVAKYFINEKNNIVIMWLDADNIEEFI